MTAPARVIVSGARPTGRQHLGNYHGALQNWLRLQSEYRCFFFVADWHALTTDWAAPGALGDNTVDMVLDPDRDPRDWAIVGTPEQCVETILQYRDGLGLDFMGLSLSTMPKGAQARKDFLQWVSEEVLSKVR